MTIEDFRFEFLGGRIRVYCETPEQRYNVLKWMVENEIELGVNALKHYHNGLSDTDMEFPFIGLSFGFSTDGTRCVVGYSMDMVSHNSITYEEFERIITDKNIFACTYAEAIDFFGFWR